MSLSFKFHKDLIIRCSRINEFVRKKMWAKQICWQILLSFSIKGLNMHPICINCAEITLFIATHIYMVQYVQHFDQKLQKTENFYLTIIFKVKHRMSSYISIFFRRKIRVWSQTQMIVRKIAVDDRKSINFTLSEKQPCQAPNYPRLQKG